MKQIITQNLGMIVTERCNLNCAMCLREGCHNRDMSKEVMEKTLEQFYAVGNLAIAGGEPTIATKQIEDLFTTVVENKVLLDQVTTVINGTYYNEEFLRLLAYINEYICSYKEKDKIYADFTISYDKYHISEIKKRDLLETFEESVAKYIQSPYFHSFQGLHDVVINEGNAKNLDAKFTTPLAPLRPVITYRSKNNKYKCDKKNGTFIVGPIVTINPVGIVTECDASPRSQEENYNYGNIFEDSIEDIILKRDDVKIVRPVFWHSMTKKQTEAYNKNKRKK